ncbi:CRISPR-associated protein Cas4 [Litorilinea aerophila]|uniref:CRISPR-associated exonuclease Cas4 n=1 Tax=Litorilinea aerophila TaxID=1204385 RepID=A0A540VA44_9CHLR|nr:CRISPR-associated protein Cas4 [Litorilinea aerophila]MCC9078491.1 CRISPR-associated protein Cas4 [Litorilinea aerophila]OUC05083.1 CRISPR-associated protein Cas4 [Litorilinea aerophila]
MTTTYSPEELLPLSGIQHFLFCRRQWALIHVERQWQENALTAEGRILHTRVDDPSFTEKRKGVIVARSVPVASTSLGLFGVCDVVEFSESAQGVHLPGYQGTYLPAPVEYKRGKKKLEPSDEAQLCAQALCLEEMLAVSIPVGYLYYGQVRRRVTVELTEALRDRVRRAAQEMHTYFQRGYTPKVKPFKGCKSCSLADICLPRLQGEAMPASAYIRQQIERG